MSSCALLVRHREWQHTCTESVFDFKMLPALVTGMPTMNPSEPVAHDGWLNSHLDSMIMHGVAVYEGLCLQGWSKWSYF